MKQKKYSTFSIKRLLNAFNYSLDGLLATFKTEAAFRLELVLLVFLLPLVFFIESSSVEKALLIGSLLIVVMFELVNTAIEAVVDRISDEKHELSKKAKDIGSALVLVAILNAIFTWGFILLGG